MLYGKQDQECEWKTQTWRVPGSTFKVLLWACRQQQDSQRLVLHPHRKQLLVLLQHLRWFTWQQSPWCLWLLWSEPPSSLLPHILWVFAAVCKSDSQAPHQRGLLFHRLSSTRLRDLHFTFRSVICFEDFWKIELLSGIVKLSLIPQKCVSNVRVFNYN